MKKLSEKSLKSLAEQNPHLNRYKENIFISDAPSFVFNFVHEDGQKYSLNFTTQRVRTNIVPSATSVTKELFEDTAQEDCVKRQMDNHIIVFARGWFFRSKIHDAVKFGGSPGFFGETRYIAITPIPEQPGALEDWLCCCGSDATYGPNNMAHAFYCPKKQERV